MRGRFEIRLSEQEEDRLNDLSSTLGVSKAEILKSSLYGGSGSLLAKAFIRSYARISESIDRKDYNSIRKEMNTLCAALNSSMSKTK